MGQNGFGYDPLFVADGQDGDQRRVDPAAKDAISPGPGGPGHRSRSGGRAATAERAERRAEKVQTYPDLLDHVLAHGVRKTTGPAPAR